MAFCASLHVTLDDIKAASPCTIFRSQMSNKISIDCIASQLFGPSPALTPIQPFAVKRRLTCLAMQCTSLSNVLLSRWLTTQRGIY